jgi:hypothetical protein
MAADQQFLTRSAERSTVFRKKLGEKALQGIEHLLSEYATFLPTFTQPPPNLSPPHQPPHAQGFTFGTTMSDASNGNDIRTWDGSQRITLRIQFEILCNHKKK